MQEDKIKKEGVVGNLCRDRSMHVTTHTHTHNDERVALEEERRWRGVSLTSHLRRSPDNLSVVVRVEPSLRVETAPVLLFSQLTLFLFLSLTHREPKEMMRREKPDTQRVFSFFDLALKLSRWIFTILGFILTQKRVRTHILWPGANLDTFWGSRSAQTTKNKTRTCRFYNWQCSD